MSIQLWLAFVAASAVLLVIPGPTILTVISYSIAQSQRSKLPLICAVALGDATALLASLVGLGTLLATSALWFTAVKLAGGIYLLYLGVKLLLSGIAPTRTAAPALPAAGWKVFINTYLVTALNPKGIIFFVAFLPLFLEPHAAVARQLWILAATFVVMATVNAALYAVFAASAARLLQSPRAQRVFNLCGGSLLCVAGAWALMAQRAL